MHKSSSRQIDLDHVGESDPLSRVLAPPRHEKPAERDARLESERMAKKRSDEIDQILERERQAGRRGMKPVKILLLGQSESGKSTTLKNFQLMASPKAFKKERTSWRAVIQLNVVRSIRLVLEAMSESITSTSETPSLSGAPNSYFPRSPYGIHAANRISYPGTSSSLESHHNLANAILTIRPPSPSGGMPEPDLVTDNGNTPGGTSSCPGLTNEHLKLRTRLMPLLQIEDVLLRHLSPSGGREADSLGTSLSSTSHSGENTKRPGTASSKRRPGTGNSTRSGRLTVLNTNLPPVDPRMKTKEAVVNSNVGWKDAFARMLDVDPQASMDELPHDWDSHGDDPGNVLSACAADIKILWSDPIVRQLLVERKVRLEDMSGFFLDSLDRICSPKYMPTDDDILRARLKTLGVSEHKFQFQAKHATNHDWRVYDVGGHRSLVVILRSAAAWVPFFDDMNAIIFLAPVNCFDQCLEEDETVNRLEDSVLLWKAIVSNELLAKTNLVLFLNKCDLLKAKLAGGVRFASHVVSYGDRPNDFESVSKYLKRKFNGLLKDYSPEPRQFYCHFTSVTDILSTQQILENVQDMIIRANLKASHLVD